MLISEIRQIARKYEADLKRLRETQSEIILFGAGSTSQFIVDQFCEKGIFPSFFCDNDEEKVGQKMGGVSVISFEELQQSHKKAIII